MATSVHAGLELNARVIQDRLLFGLSIAGEGMAFCLSTTTLNFTEQ